MTLTDLTVMTEWKRYLDTNIEVSSDGRVRRNGVEFVPCIDDGYRNLWLKGKVVTLHRLIAAAFIPNPMNKPFVDHIDGDKLNNMITNLRWATNAENMRNRKSFDKESQQPRGVSKHGKRYRARIRYEGKLIHLGSYDTPEEASAAYEAKAQELFGEFYRLITS